MNERILRHFVKIYIPCLSKYEVKSIFLQYIDKNFDQKIDKHIYEISKKVIDKLSAFIFKNH